MKNLINKEYQKQLDILTIILIIIVFGFFIYKQIGLDEELHNEELNDFFKGRVKNKFIDDYNHNQPMIIFENDSLFGIYKEWYDLIDKGDSVVKKIGTDSLLILKNHDTIIVNSPRCLE